MKKLYICSAKSNPDGESSTRPFALQVGLFLMPIAERLRYTVY